MSLAQMTIWPTIWPTHLAQVKCAELRLIPAPSPLGQMPHARPRA